VTPGRPKSHASVTSPAERVAFVLHDVFELPFEEIAPMVDRTPVAARQLASRARRRLKGADVPAPDCDLARQRESVDAFFLAARGGDFDALVAVLDHNVVLRSDWGTKRPAAPRRSGRRQAGTDGHPPVRTAGIPRWWTGQPEWLSRWLAGLSP
jgi:RNA polymerase sigma-70 factor, ECF subfamily